MTTPQEEILRTLRDAPRVIIGTHVKPDGDALGSTLGLARILTAAGLRTQVTMDDPVPVRYAFMVGDGELCPSTNARLTPEDVLVMLDCADLKIAPDFVRDRAPGTRTINIDHHHGNTRFGDVNVVDEAASSAGEMVYLLATQTGLEIPAPAAEALWVAMVTDTGRFAYQNTSPRAMEAAADLLRRGVRTSLVNDQVYESLGLKELQLRHRALGSLEVRQDGRVTMASLSQQDFDDLEAGPEDAQDMVNLPRSLRGTEVALFFYEIKRADGATATKMSCRAAEPFDASELCRFFGGGGHKRAAGCTLETHLPEAQATVLAHMDKVWFA